MKTILSALVMLVTLVTAQAQLPRYLQDKVTYPVLDDHPYMGVIDTDVKAMAYDRKLEYKVVIDVYDDVTDSASMHSALLEAARTYNLNIANGVPREKLKMAVVIHGFAVWAILDGPSYMKRFGTENPNLKLLSSLEKAGVELFVCGQNLGMMRIPPEDLAPQIQVTLSAKTTFITLDQMGYSYLNVNEE